MTAENEGKFEHGTVQGYSYWHCRCHWCAREWKMYCLGNKLDRMSKGVPEGTHGTPNGYRNYDCRCPKCKAAWAEHCSKKRASRRLKKPDRVHGTPNGYRNYGCRCDPCKASVSRKTEKPKQVDDPNGSF